MIKNFWCVFYASQCTTCYYGYFMSTPFPWTFFSHFGGTDSLTNLVPIDYAYSPWQAARWHVYQIGKSSLNPLDVRVVRVARLQAYLDTEGHHLLLAELRRRRFCLGVV